MLSTSWQSCYNRSASKLLGQLCNKSDVPVKLITSRSNLVDNFGQAERTQLVDGLSTDVVEVRKFLGRVVNARSGLRKENITCFMDDLVT